MIALKIEDLKEFTKQLFTGETFDRFLVKEAAFSTFCSFAIDGELRRGFLEEASDSSAVSADNSSPASVAGNSSPVPADRYAAWKLLRPHCFQIIKGKQLPESFSVVLKLPAAGTEKFVRSTAPNLAEGTISGLYLNIRYSEKMLNCVTAVSYGQFTLDKSVEREWDESIRKFLKTSGIAAAEG
ncbi:MAG: DUF5721 family protein [Bacillota bacterium]|nr:DUF5721 family protein [Bacillota bacterium]